MIDRRLFLAGLTGLAAGTAGCAGYVADRRSARADFRELRAGLGPNSRLGVAVIETGSGRMFGHDMDARYALCSVFKLPLAAAILAEAEAGRLRLDEEITFTRADLISHAPVVEAHLAQGRLSIERLCAAIVEVSDNAAANLLLARVGGPAGLTAFIRRQGDGLTRLDRPELELNTNLPGDPRDTTTPAAMAGLMRTLLLGNGLGEASRRRLMGWLEQASTGRDRLRAGIPAGWRAGDKTGTGNGAVNDVAIVWPPARPPILIACFIDARDVPVATANATHAAVARLVAAALA